LQKQIYKMRIISNLFYFSLSLLLFIFNFASYSYAIGNVDWVLLKENNDWKEWLDKGSIKSLPNGEISVLTKFFKNPTNSDDDGELSLYVMRINCNEKKFKDTKLSLGGSLPPLDIFKLFRGREPQTDSLIRHLGLSGAT